MRKCWQSIDTSAYNFYNETFIGAVAQLGERLNGIQEVRGSTPLSSTKKNKGLADVGEPFLLAVIAPNNSCGEVDRTCGERTG